MTAHYIVHRSSGMEEDDGRRDRTLAETDVGTAGAGGAQGERLWRGEL